MAHILVVTNHTAIREELYDLLVRGGHAVETAVSPTQVVEMLKDRRPQLILTDARRDRLDLLREIRLVDEQVPVALLAAAGAAEVPSAILEADRHAVLLDGTCRPEWLLERIKELVSCTGKAPEEERVPVEPTGTILVVDDDPKIRRLLKSFFESRGLRVLTASSGEEALHAVAQKPLVVLMDVNMPGMDGLVALRKLKSLNSTIPVIIISGLVEGAMVQEGLRAGAYDYVSKPFNLDYLDTIVQTKILLGKSVGRDSLSTGSTSS